MEKDAGTAMLSLTWTWRGVPEGMSLYRSLLDGFINKQVMDILRNGNYRKYILQV